MVDESTLKILRNLASDVVMLDYTSPPGEWKDVANKADTLVNSFQGPGETGIMELAVLMGAVAARLATGAIANPAGGVKAVQHIVGCLQGLENPAGVEESLRKQALAEANIFLKDVKKEESAADLASDIDDEEQREILIALEQRVNELDQDLLNLAPPVSDAETVRSIFRQYHTLKGEGAICGFKIVADFCHRIESEIEDARHGKLVLTRPVVESLQGLTDLLRPILSGQTIEEVGSDLVASLMEELSRSVREAKEQAAPEAETEDAAPKEDQFADFFAGFVPPPEPLADETDDKPSDDSEQPAPEPVAAEKPRYPEPETPASSPVPAGAPKLPPMYDDDDIDVIPSVEEVNDARRRNGGGKTDESILIISPEPAKPAPNGATPKAGETVIDSGDIASQLKARGATKSMEERPIDANEIKAIPVDINVLDNLMELVSEVTLMGFYFSTRLADNTELQGQANSFARACNRLQEAATSLRMTSIRPLFMTVRRAAVESARSSRKLIEINLRGADTQVDRSIVENLSAALIHVIRNAVDHGIEPTDERRAAGKPERGSITIGAQRTDADVIIELGDDGKGFDLQAIHDKAAAMGKIRPGDVLSDEEVADLVFLPGLSTAKQITGLSGRGVGMEIVRNSIDDLRGKVEIKTAKGKGSTIRMRFPLSLAAMEGMLVRVGKTVLVLPVAQVRECFRATAADVGTIEGRGTIVTIRGVVVPVLFLDREFGMEIDSRNPEDGVLVLVENGELLTAVLVDETLGSQQVVIRSLEGDLANLPLISGTAILPDRSIGLVVEVGRLTERVSIAGSKAFSAAGDRQAGANRQVDTVSIGSNQVGMIDFSILAPAPWGGTKEHVFAINAFKTREFVSVEELRPLPNAPSGFAGMMRLRDTIIPIVNMGVVLGLMSEGERRPDWERIVLVCEFAGRTVGFLVTNVNRVSYISWSDILPPPNTAGLIQLDYIVGMILMDKLKGALTDSAKKLAETAPAAGRENGQPAIPTAMRVENGSEFAEGGEEGEEIPLFDANGEEILPGNFRNGGRTNPPPAPEPPQVAFVIDFERVVGNVIQLYGDMGAELGDMGSSRKGGCRILLVEDSPLIRKKTRKALADAGITVLEAGDGQEAWDKIQELKKEAEASGNTIFSYVDLVLSDIEMPRMDGYTFTHQMKHDQTLRVLPILLHSSITNDNMIARANEVEADGFIPKCDPKELAAQLRKYL